MKGGGGRFWSLDVIGEEGGEELRGVMAELLYSARLYLP